MASEKTTNKTSYKCSNFKIADTKLKQLNPINKHIGIIEAKRIENSMNELIENVKLGLGIAAYCNNDEEQNSDGEFERLLKQHRKTIAGSINQQISHELNHHNGRNKDFKASLSKLISYFRKINSINTEDIEICSTGSRLFMEYLNDIWMVIRNSLLTGPDEENRKVHYINDVLERSRKSHDIIVFKEKQLEEELNFKRKEIAKYDLEISMLSGELENLKNETEEEHSQILSDANKQIYAENRHLERCSGEMVQNINELRERLQSNRRENYENETALRKKRYKLTTELHNWITKYDEDLQWRQEMIEEIVEEEKINKTDLKELETQFEKLEIKFQEIMKEKKEKAEKERIKLKDIARKVQAAICIQAHWKGYVLRQILAGRHVGATRKAKGKKRKGKKK